MHFFPFEAIGLLIVVSEKGDNSPFYSCVLGCQAFVQE